MITTITIIILLLVIISMMDAIKQGYLFGQSHKYLSIFIHAGYLDFIVSILAIFAAYYYRSIGRPYIDIIYVILTVLSIFNGATKYMDFRDKNDPTPKI